MAKFYMMGNYTTQGFQGFLKDPKSDRSKAAQAASEAVGAKMVSYTGLRGAYDFCVIAEGTFEQAAASAMVAVSSGAVSDFTIHEVVNLNSIAKIANKMASGYKAPGK